MTARIVAGSGRSLLGEGCLWSASAGAIYWVDILGKRLRRLTLATGSVAAWEMPRAIGWVIERRDRPGLIAGLDTGFAWLTLEPFAVLPFLDPEPHLPANRMNDACADRHGRIWAGTMPFACDVPSGAFYRLDPDRRCVRVDGPYQIPNGPAILPDASALFHTDTARGHIYRLPIHDDGSLGPRTLFVDFEDRPGDPDGMTLDADGGLWVAHWGGARVTRFDPAGRAERHIPLPASQVTSTTFAGDDLSRLFVTSAATGIDDEPEAGALFEVDPGCRGLPTERYAG
jgi:sugar lactone lactonase YvrE